MDNLREELAKLAHEQWSGWMRYLFSKCEPGDGDLFFEYEGVLVIPAWAVERWKRQMNTPFEALSEEEKESDRTEADKFLAVLESDKVLATLEKMKVTLEELGVNVEY